MTDETSMNEPDSSSVAAVLAPTAQRPGRPVKAPCHICHQPQPPCPHEGCWRHYSDGHRNVQTTTLDENGMRHSETRCVDCGAFFGASSMPLEWALS